MTVRSSYGERDTKSSSFWSFAIIIQNRKSSISIAVVFNSVNYRHCGKQNLVKAGFSGLCCLFSSNTALLTDRSNVAMQKRHFKAVFLFYSQQKQQKKLHSPSCSTSAWIFSSLVPLLVTGTHAVHSRSSWF